MKQLTQELYNEMIKISLSPKEMTFGESYYDIKNLKFNYKLWKFIKAGHFNELTTEEKEKLINGYDINSFNSRIFNGATEYALAYNNFDDKRIEDPIEYERAKRSEIAIFINPICVNIMKDKNWKNYGIEKDQMIQIFNKELSVCRYDLNLQFNACKFIMENNDYFQYSANDFQELIENSNLIWNKSKLDNTNYYDFFQESCDSSKATEELFNIAKNKKLTLTESTWEELNAGYKTQNMIENMKMLNPIDVIYDKLRFKFFKKLGNLSIQKNTKRSRIC